MHDKKLVTLVKRAARGDVDAFEEVYFEHAQSVLFHVRNQIIDKESYQDVAQDVALSLWKNIGQLREPAAFRGWMHQIIRTTCVSHNRKVLAELKKRTSGNEEEIIDELPSEAQGDGSDPALLLMQKDDEHRLFIAIQKLPPAYREAITLRYFDGFTYKEIATALGISTSAVGTNILRGTEHLKREFLEENKEAAAKAQQDIWGQAKKAEEASEKANTIGHKGKAMKEEAEQKSSAADNSGIKTGTAVAGAFVVSDQSIQSSLTTGINEIVPVSAVELYVRDVHINLASVIAAGTAAGATASAAAASSVGGKLVAIIASVVLATGALTVGGYHFVQSNVLVEETTAWSTPESVVEETIQYEGDPHILFTSTRGENSPYGVVAIVIQDSAATPQSIEWAVQNASGEQLFSGEGASIDVAQDLASLDAGEYKVVFTLTDERGASAISSRTFTIEKQELSKD